MSTFESFMRGREIGQQQVKQRRVDETRQRASEAFGAGNYESAESLLMGIGALDEADAYARAGARKVAQEQEEAQTRAYSKAGAKGGPKAQMSMALESGDMDTAKSIQEFISSADESQREAFTQGMEFLGRTALGVKGVAPEMRAQALSEIIAGSPFGNEQVMASIAQAAQDGVITDEELDQFAMQTVSAAEQVKMAQPKPREVVTGQDDIFLVDNITGEKRSLGIQPKQPASSNVTVNNMTGEALTPMQRKADEIWAGELAEWQRAGSSDSIKQINQLSDVVTRLESGEDLTGVLLGLAPPPIRIGFNEGSVDAQQLVEEVVQRSLRTTLGAQFTEREGERLIARAYNPQAKEETNARRVKALLNQIVLRASVMDAALQHSNEFGTMKGFNSRAPSVDDFYSAIDDADKPAGSVSPQGWDEQMRAAQEALSPEEFREYQELMAKQGR